MKRNNLIKLLERYNPVGDEAVAKAEMLKFIRANENCFDREFKIGHITGSSWLINKQGDKALLMHHAKLDKWLQLGGHADGESDILAVAIKEASEESGIKAIEPKSSDIFDIDIHKIPANKKDKEHFHYDVRFLLQVTSEENIEVNEESKELRWISKDKKELPTNEMSVVRMFQKWKRQ
jgi:8-oxo-dGTP pyrophosphatase MutT (NUDIX family)